jgi:hypothetical protein
MRNAFLFAILVCGSLASAQPAIFQQTQTTTTGMIGFTTNQTARLNVLNLTAVPTGATVPSPSPCAVELRFVDPQNNQLSQTAVANLAPGTATSFDLPRSAVTSQTTPRAEIRGVVVVNPAANPYATPVAVGFCSVMATLEIMDATGSTIAVTSDTRTVGTFVAVPLAAR